MKTSLFLNNEQFPPPFEYLELQMMRDVYHCDPVTFESIPYDTVMLHIALLNVENEVEQFKNGKSSPKPKPLNDIVSAQGLEGMVIETKK